MWRPVVFGALIRPDVVSTVFDSLRRNRRAATVLNRAFDQHHEYSCTPVLGPLLHFWSENSDKLRGKYLLLEADRGCLVQEFLKFISPTFKKFDDSTQNLPFRRCIVTPCPKTAGRRIKTKTKTTPCTKTAGRGTKTKYVLPICSKRKFDCIDKRRHLFFKEASPVYQFKEEKRYPQPKLYFSFETAATKGSKRCHTNCYDLSFMQDVRSLCVLFA
uniref:Ribosomal_L18A domain-containing protein n=1 Tax=Steinernema glaseri TaxID=37863 RepID=A0A1I7YCW7_9BILA